MHSTQHEKRGDFRAGFAGASIFMTVNMKNMKMRIHFYKLYICLIKKHKKHFRSSGSLVDRYTGMHDSKPICAISSSISSQLFPVCAMDKCPFVISMLYVRAKKDTFLVFSCFF